MGAGRDSHSHAQNGPALELIIPPSLIAKQIEDFWLLVAPRASEASVGEAGGAEGQGLSPSLHCPLSCPGWPSRSPQRASESRPWRAAWRRAVGTEVEENVERERGGFPLTDWKLRPERKGPNGTEGRRRRKARLFGNRRGWQADHLPWLEDGWRAVARAQTESQGC